ncbi:MAG: exodeoxyribonuclease V subunit gamma, partial [Pseudomonadota bacterium]
MLYYYPSNRLEHLADILSHLLDKNTSSPFETPQILLPHTGLQHWLSLYLAKQQRIMMNVDFPLPTRFVWDLSRNVLGKANVPTQSPYKREVLQWRIFEILSSQENDQDSLASFFTYFNLSQRDTAQMFDVAVRLADVFEQYAVYRPQWLTDWEKGRDPSEFKDIDSDVMGWQKTLWQRLYAQNSNTPVALQHQAEIQLASKANTLPEHIYLFAVGSLPPQFMRFFFVLSQETNVHFLILNPCQIYWGDALTDKQISTLERKNKTVDLQAERDINPLLRNLGQQGKEFIDAVLQQQHVQIDAFESLLTAELTLLQSIQQGILDGERKTTFSEKPSSTNGIDDSICIHACHSPVRELQVLKEVLLQSLKDNSSLQLDEILVLTPNIEDYAPFVETVFSDPLESNLDLSVSISDRRPVESDPDIKSFISVLALANSRFSVEDVFAPLSSDALKQFFALDSDEIERIQQWLSASAVVWGKDLVHKQAVIDASELNDKHTWYAAIQRLAIGMCNPQESFVADGIALADVVEGQQQQV